ncbi:hypothetical protein DFH08DRAFT_678203 [Mycena albidolilacea]|uniref:Protein CPL1-like domain-containing protein n=1 Tax=Mycena albidolilacea TaxID=1033008 RepID=A0AAD7AWL6_9AGAR|nr:hypothetical protein DFH08DRAFT_678203 [Mycena albidolilacea]
MLCNGQCLPGPSCPTVRPPLPRRARSECPEGLTSCPVPGRSFGGWDCIDTRNDLESCGGCMYSVSSETAGQDCTALLGVNDVSCIKGQCAVRKCMLGYKLYEDHTHCVESGGLFNQLFRI